MGEYPNIDGTRNWQNLDPGQDPARSGHGRASDVMPRTDRGRLSRLMLARWLPYAVVGVMVAALVVILLVAK